MGTGPAQAEIRVMLAGIEGMRRAGGADLIGAANTYARSRAWLLDLEDPQRREVVEHLRALREAATERLEVIDLALLALGEAAAANGTASMVQRDPRYSSALQQVTDAQTTEQAILLVLGQLPVRNWSPKEVLEVLLTADRHATKAMVESQLSRLARQGAIARPGRGRYCLLEALM